MVPKGRYTAGSTSSPRHSFEVLFWVDVCIQLVIDFWYGVKIYLRNRTARLQSTYIKVSSARYNTEEAMSQLDQITEVNSADIYIGDILKIRRGEVCPCDLLILSTSDHGKPNQFVAVDSFLQNGVSALETKEPLAVLKNFEFADATFKSYLKRLTAKLQYFRCRRDGRVFGTFKLTTDPRGEQFSDEKVLSLGSVLHSDFVVGVALFVGRKCLSAPLSQNFVSATKSSVAHQKQRAFAALSAIVCLVSCLYSKLAAVRVAAFLGRPVGEVEAPSSFATYLSLYFACFVLWLNTVLNLACWVQGLLLQREYNRPLASDISNAQQPILPEKSGKELKILKKPADRSSQNHLISQNKFEVFDPTVLPDLGCVDDIIFDKSGTLVENRFQVATIATKNNFYHANQEPGFLIDHSQIEILDVSDINPELVFGEYQPKSIGVNGLQTESKKVILVNVEDKKQILSGMGAEKPVSPSVGAFKSSKPDSRVESEAFGKQVPLSQLYKTSKFTNKQDLLGANNAQIGWSEVKAGPFLTTENNPSSAQIPIEELEPALAEAKKQSNVESNFQQMANRPMPIRPKLHFDKNSESSNDKSPKSSKGNRQEVQSPTLHNKKGQSNSPFKIELTSAKQEDAISIEEGVVVATESPEKMVKGVMQFLHEYKTKEVSELLTLFSICQDSRFSDGK